jgi:predicted nucleotidyltransferase
VSEADIDQEIEKVFSDVCGEHGRKEFIHYTVAAIKQVYGTNYRKAGLRLLEIIDKGAERKPSEIGKYFKEAVSQAELEFNKKNKDEVVKDLQERIEKAILEFRGRYGERYNGVVGAIVFGSYAKENFHLKSDLDIVYITKSRNKGLHISPYQHEFDDWLDRKVKPVVRSDTYDPIAMSDVEALQNLTGEGSMVGEGYVVISPYPEIKKAIQDAFANNSKEETI